MVKRVAIIGAGTSGLVAIKSCLDEGLEPICFERFGDIGGLWNYQGEVTPERASLYKSLLSNVSKGTMCFSDYPIPEDYPLYMRSDSVLEYHRLYAKQFDLLKYIRFKHTITSVKKRADFASSGQWDVVTKDGNDKVASEIFDAVMVCTGLHTDSYIPFDSFPGIEKFRGKYMHSKDFKEPEVFQGKKVLIVGIANSAGDLAVEISKHAKKVFLSSRRGTWIMHRITQDGSPMDMVILNRFVIFLLTVLPLCLINWFAKKTFNFLFNHDNHGPEPEHRFLSECPMINDDLPSCIKSGNVLMKRNLKRFTETAVIFEDGTVEEDIEVVIFATGYTYRFPFLDEKVVKVENNHAGLYKYVYPPQLEKPTLVFIGYIQPIGAVMPISELQSRGATRVFKALLPSHLKSTNDNNKLCFIWYGTSQGHAAQVDWIAYLDSLADMIGVKPSKMLFLSDPLLAFQIFFGPCTAFQYRLTEPGKWPEARKIILTQWSRIFRAPKSCLLANDEKQSSMPLMLQLLAAFVVLAAVLFFFLGA
uniref:Flavin-containing monooxygenase n=1 Tax=Callorhinchus milii TaxID=7868 RepID=A0A4W3K451_CALMI